MNPTQQLAKIALDMLAQVSIKAGDQEILTVTAVRNMLRQIATKELELVAPTPAPSSELPNCPPK
jgi:hypothetical protein